MPGPIKRRTYKTRSALRVFKPAAAAPAAAAAAATDYNYKPILKMTKKTGAPGACFEKHETAPTGRYFELGEGYYAFLGFYRNEIGLHIRVYLPDGADESALIPTKEGCVIWGHNSISYFLDLAPLMSEEYKKGKVEVLRHPIEDSNLFVLIGKEFGEIRISIRRMVAIADENKSTESEKSYTAYSGGASLTMPMWSSLIECIPDIRDTMVELEQYEPVATSTKGNIAQDGGDDASIDVNIVKWGVNNAVMEEIRKRLPPKILKDLGTLDRESVFDEVVKVFDNYALDDLVCAVYRRSRNILRGSTVETVEKLVRNCYSQKVQTSITEMMLNSV